LIQQVAYLFFGKLLKNKEKLITAQTDCEIPGLQTAANFFRYPLQDPIPS
jgi:hypothetical protein